jgi:hypothetical protein
MGSTPVPLTPAESYVIANPGATRIFAQAPRALPRGRRQVS